MVRFLAALVLLSTPFGIIRDYRYRPYRDLGFQKFAREFEQAPPGTEMTIPINPDFAGHSWLMQLRKREH